MTEHAEQDPVPAPVTVATPVIEQPILAPLAHRRPLETAVGRSTGAHVGADDDPAEREADDTARLVRRALSVPSPAGSATSRIRRAVPVGGESNVIRRTRADGRPNKLPVHLTAAYFKQRTFVRGAKRGESLSTIDKWLAQAESAPTYDDQQYALKQVVDAANHWLTKHGDDAGGGRRSVRSRRGAVDLMETGASMAYRGAAAPAGSSGVEKAGSPEGTGESQIEVAGGLLDAVADGAGITGDFADRNLALGDVSASKDGQGTAMSAESGAALNSTPFDVLETVNVVSGGFAIRDGFKDLGDEDNDALDDAEAGGRVLAGGGQMIHGAYKGWKAVGVMAGGDATGHTQIGDVGAAYGDGLGAIADTLTTIKGWRDAQKKGREQGGLTAKEKRERNADLAVGALSATQKTTKTALDITKAATEVGATHAIAGLSTAAGAVGLVVSVIETVRGGLQIYEAWNTTRDLEAAEHAQNVLIATTMAQIEEARASTTALVMDPGFEVTDSDFQDLVDVWAELEVEYKALVTTQARYKPAMDGMKKLQARQAEEGAFKAAKGTVGIVSGALLLSGVGAPIAVGVAAVAGIIALSEAGLKLARNSAATGLIQIARRLDDSGRPSGRPENAPSYRVMESRVYAAYYRSLKSVIKSEVPWGFEEGEFGAIKQFAWDQKKREVPSEKREVVQGFGAVDGLSQQTKEGYWIEVHAGEKVFKEKPKGVAKAVRAVSPSAHKSGQAMEASKDDIVNALFDLGLGSFDGTTGRFKTDVPIDARGDVSAVDNMELITVGALLSAADITSERWAAWIGWTAPTPEHPKGNSTTDPGELRKLIRAQLP